MKVELPYADGTLTAVLPSGTRRLSSEAERPLAPLANLDEAVSAALEAPLGLPRIRDLVKPGARVTIAFDDHTTGGQARVGYGFLEDGDAVEVGPQPLEGFDDPDVCEQPFHRVDLAISQRLGNGLQLKLTGSNLLNSAIVLDQGGITVLQYRPGISFSAALGWTL